MAAATLTSSCQRRVWEKPTKTIVPASSLKMTPHIWITNHSPVFSSTHHRASGLVPKGTLTTLICRVYLRNVHLDKEFLIVKVNSDVLEQRQRPLQRGLQHVLRGVFYIDKVAPVRAAGFAGADGGSLGGGVSLPAVAAAGGGLNFTGGGELLAAGLLFDRPMAEYAEEQAAIDARVTDKVCAYLMRVIGAGFFDELCGSEVEGFEWGNNEEIDGRATLLALAPLTAPSEFQVASWLPHMVPR
ncbi:hypothetical protein BDK51DRAFT_29968 [Blyttiomyces helicus]|uniref:Uncharacterized protein n=1 Tax=Blyttiomyces helicus TaxID=388810 RepID=A0A4P9WRZ3_9FUNG|nr:hypothetical protein BDK51DRAFT_29968 [Blyttiomyces helicus]|eukprot:RKO93726.1 hypothetical protein BDK51DRAFT_29968 [Blyttiomyces helicus]